ncbi:hypothetical protein B0H10DRAFT_2238923 [Mycena sp. CBHHK59/15]|nr:hypothetical protein B0H10DRAFT_2238923 [Mycena sp. CBHHK59/15]
MPFCPPSPPPAYEMPPQYDLGPSESADTSSSPTLAVLRPVSPTLDELEIQTFGMPWYYYIANISDMICRPSLRLPPFEPLADPSSPSLSFSASARVNPSHVHSFENSNLPIPMDRFHFPDPMLEGVPLPAIDAQSGQGSSQLSVFPIAPKPKATRARRSAPPARPASPEEEVPEAKNFEVMLWVPFDQGLDDYMQSISENYPPGTCSMHPEIECFHSRVNDMHYALDRPKKIVWAAAIKNGTSTILAPPLGSNHFKAKAALKKIAVTATASAPSVEPPATQAAPPAAPPPATPCPNPYGYPSAPSYPPLMGYPPFLSPFPSYQPHRFYGHPSHMLPWQDTPQPRRRERSPDGSSPPRASSSKRRREDPPSSPAFSGGSIDEFLTQNPGLPGPTQSFLLELDFEIGDDLSVVTEAQWKAAGFALLAGTVSSKRTTSIKILFVIDHGLFSLLYPSLLYIFVRT